jgi:predicted acetyltransferase
VPYLATIDGTPVGTTIVAFGGGVAGIYAVAVLKGARRRGVGSALTLTALRDARERGYRIATLRASRMGYPMYRRLGFEQHCTIGSWVSEPQQRP